MQDKFHCVKIMQSSLKVFNSFLCTFIVFGLAPFAIQTTNSTTGKSSGKVSIRCLLSKLVPLTVMLINLGQFSLLLTVVDGTLDGKVHETLFYGYFFLIILSNIVGNIQCLAYSLVYWDIACQINCIEHLFMVKFHNRIDFNGSLKIFKRKLWTIISVLFFATLINFWNHEWRLSTDLLLRSIVTILELISSMVSLHPVLYVGLVNVFIVELSRTLKTSTDGQFQGSVGVCKDLKNLKCIHFEVWYLAQKINKYFGWGFVFLIIKYFIDVLYLLYWVFIEIVELGWCSLTHVESSFSLIHSLLCLITLSDSCHNCLTNISILEQSIEQFTFSTFNNASLHNCKNEVISQIRRFPIQITAKDFVSLDRIYLSDVATGCCMYVIIFIQFFFATDVEFLVGAGDKSREKDTTGISPR